MERLKIGQGVFRAALALAPLSLCANCARPPVASQPANWDSTDTRWLAETEAPASRILTGFDETHSEISWQVGAEVLYSVLLEGRGAPQTRFIHFKLHSGPLKDVRKVRVNPLLPAANAKDVLDIRDPDEGSYELTVPDWAYYFTTQEPSRQGVAPNSITSGAVVAWMALYDETGNKLKSHYELLPERHLRNGLARYCESAGNAGPPECQAALQSFGKVVGVSPIAEPLIKRILSRSTLIGMWLFGRPKFTFDLGQPSPETRPLPALVEGRRAWQLPIDISMDGKATLRSRATVMPPDGPLRLCAGVVAFEGYRIDDPSRRFHMVLVAAHLPDASP